MSIHTVLSPDYTVNSTPFLVPEMPGFVLSLQNVLTLDECFAIVKIAESTGFVRASLITDKDGTEHYSEIRKSDRCILDSHPFVAELYKRLKPFIPTEYNGCQSVNINERLRILRYNPGDEFKLHSDGCYVAPDGSSSHITILLYLNEEYEGGFTTFLDSKDGYTSLTPHTGMATLQDQRLLHVVPPLEKGVKYVMRTEVMYSAPKSFHENIKVVKLG
jgi:hypothetical protein